MVNQNKLRQKIAFIDNSLQDLHRLARATKEEFMADTIGFHAAVRLLQVCVEAMLDAAGHIVATEKLGLPKTYAHSFELLAAGHVIPRDFADRAKQMARFRNRVVHLYDTVDPCEIYNILQSNLGDFEEFIRLIAGRYLTDQHPGKEPEPPPDTGQHN